MQGPNAVQADFVHIRPLKSRDEVDLIFTIPKSPLPHVLKTLGNPLLGESLWCAIVRLHPEAVKQEEEIVIPKFLTKGNEDGNTAHP